MRREWEAADRVAEVRRAVTSWRRAGVLDEKTEEAMSALYPSRRAASGLVWKALVFFFVSAAALGGYLAAELALQPSSGVRALLCLSLAVIFIAATEALFDSPRAAGNGIEGATSYWAAVFLALAAFVTLEPDFRGALTAFFLVGVLAFAAACYRWGFPALAGLASAFGFFFLARFPGSRVSWIVSGIFLAAAAVWLSNRGNLPPSRRRAGTAILAVSLLAIYAAINLYSWDERLIEDLQETHRPAIAPWPAIPILFGLATALFPEVLLVWGIRSRRTLLLDLAIVTGALSLWTFQHYAKPEPLWAFLLAAGLGIVAAAAWTARWLANGPLRERSGWTGEELVENEERQQAIEAAAAAAALGPAAEQPTPAERSGFEGGGGKSGGAGASGSF